MPKMFKPLELFLTFSKIGAFTFGGGYAMIPLIQMEVAENKHWVSEADILDVVAIAESTPGPIAINAATFIGQKVAGTLGAISATAGVVLPSFLIIAIISLVLREFQHIQAVKYAFWGIRAGVLALILKALFNMYKQCEKNLYAYIVMALSFIAVAFLNINAILVIILCAVSGIVLRRCSK